MDEGRHDTSEHCSPSTNPGRDAKGRFAPGNPGRPPGTKLRATRAAEALLEGQTEALTQKAVQMALDGDTTALRLCLERLIPPAKSRPVRLTLPELRSASDISSALAKVVESVAAGEITLDEGSAVAGLLEVQRKAVETEELERRLTALETERGR